MNTTVALRLLVVALGFLAISAPLTATTFVVPASYVNSEAVQNNVAPFSGREYRYQQVYASSQFLAVPAGGAYLTKIAFRPDHIFGEPKNWTLQEIRISFSTTSKAPYALDGVFANNIGPDNVVAYGPGPLSLSTLDAGPSPGPKAFDAVIQLTTPFFYDPAAGNLLMDVQVPRGVAPFMLFDGTPFDATAEDPFTSRVWISDPHSPTALAAAGRNVGLVTQFTFVPEPTAFAIAAALAATAVLTRRQ